MTRILGIDPGSLITGYGLIEMAGSKTQFVDCGCIRTPNDSSLAERLKDIFIGVSNIIEDYQPDEMAIEQVFVSRNPASALKLGQARGAAICAGALLGLAVSEYTPRSIKQAIVGKGGADKDQVQHMVRALLNLPERPQADAADALAVALCHGHTSRTVARLQNAAAAQRWR